MADIDIISLARDLVALWESPRIQAASRQDRNAAIEDTRNALIAAVHLTPCSSTVELSAHNRSDASSTLAGATRPLIDRMAEALRDIIEMIDNCADVPRNPDSLPMMVLHHARRAVAEYDSQKDKP